MFRAGRAGTRHGELAQADQFGLPELAYRGFNFRPLKRSELHHRTLPPMDQAGVRTRTRLGSSV